MSWWCVLVCLVLTSCRTPSRSPAHAEFVRRSQPLLGTFVVIAAYGPDRLSIDSAATAAFAEIRRIDSLLSIHRADSELALVNREAAVRPIPVSTELFSLLTSAQRVAAETDGSFDVTIRPVADLWGFIWKQYRLPAPDELARVLPLVGYEQVELNGAQRTVRFLKPGVSIDLGGIGKGYAVDRAIAVLRERGITNAMVRAGGDLRVMGTSRGQEAWMVQIEDPAKTGQRTSIFLRDSAISTSGNYENFFITNSKRYAHVLNPRTGLPVEGVAACSVIAPTCTESDAWATALMVLGPGETQHRFAKRFPVRFVVVDQQGRLQTRAFGFPETER